MLSLASKCGPCRRVASLLFFALAVATVHGCGSSQSTQTATAPGEGKAPGEVLKPEQLWKYEGEGKDKRKVAISRKERIKLLREAKKSD